VEATPYLFSGSITNEKDGITTRSYWAKRWWKTCLTRASVILLMEVSLTPLSIWPDVAVERCLRHVKPLADLRRRDIGVFHERLDLRQVFL